MFRIVMSHHQPNRSVPVRHRIKKVAPSSARLRNRTPFRSRGRVRINYLLHKEIRRRQNAYAVFLGGGRGIRTPGPRERSTVFKTVAINHSAIPPNHCAVGFSHIFKRRATHFYDVNQLASSGFLWLTEDSNRWNLSKKWFQALLHQAFSS